VIAVAAGKKLGMRVVEIYYCYYLF